MARLTKTQITEKLSALGIQFDADAKVDDLLALLPTEDNTPPETNLDPVTVFDPRGNPHRTYSLDIHGENYRQLAEQFISHPDRKGWTVH